MSGYAGMERPWRKEKEITDRITSDDKEPEPEMEDGPWGGPERRIDKPAPPRRRERQDCPEYDANIAKLKEIFKYEGIFKASYGPRGREIIVNAFNICKRHMDALAYDEKITATNEEVDVLIRASNIILDVVLLKEITDFVRDLTLEFTLLVINWNNNIAGCEELSRKTLAARRLVIGYMTFEDLINVSRELVRKMEGVVRYVPAGYELSRHYLEVIDEEK